jgi:2-methylcitrate dehydratase PrpD
MSKTNGVSRTVEQRTANLIEWTSSLTFSAIPTAVINRAKSFFLDTIACSIAGQSHPAVKSFLSFAQQMGPKTGTSEFFFCEETTSPAFAAFVNGGASHVVELDDLNNAGMIHPVPLLDEVDVGHSCISSGIGGSTGCREYRRGISNCMCCGI